MINKFKIILITSLILFLLLVFIYNKNNENFNQRCSDEETVEGPNSWKPYGATHKECITKCYDETKESIDDDLEKELKTFNNENDVLPFHNDDLVQFDYNEFNKKKTDRLFKNYRVEQYFDQLWKKIKRTIYLKDNDNNDNKKERYSNCFIKCFDCKDCDFKRDMSLSDKNILLSVIPENQKVTLIWKLNFSNVVKKFIITIKEKNLEHIVKTIEVPRTLVKYNYNFTIDNLQNNKIYIVNVNCLLLDENVIVSNSIEVMPNNISKINYNEVVKLKKNKNTSILDLLKGKILNINIS